MAAKPKNKKEDKPKVVAPKLVGVSSVDVLDPNGEYIRTYSKKVHGADFKKLAEGFVSKVEGRKLIKSASKVKEVEAAKEEDEAKATEEELEEAEVE